MKISKHYLVTTPPNYLQCPKAQLQPIVAKEGDIMTDLDKLEEVLGADGTLRPLITVKSPEHWADAVKNLDEEVDAILPFSVPALPTEVWNSHPQPLVEKQLPVIFWPLLDFNISGSVCLSASQKPRGTYRCTLPGDETFFP